MPPAALPLLALDSAMAACSVAVWRDGLVLAHRRRMLARGQAEALMPMVRAVMTEAGLGFDALGGLAVTVGPGSFTGLRVGLAAARGLALATGLPLVGVTTFEAIAAGTRAARRAGRPLLVAIDTKRRDVYAQVFGPDLMPLDIGTVAKPEAIAMLVPEGSVAVAGDGAEMVLPALAQAGRSAEAVPPALPDAADIAAVAATRLDAAEPGRMPAPLYLRAPEATRPAAAGRLRP